MILLILIALFVAYLVYQWREVRTLPPGPHPFPLVGNIPQLFYYILKNGSLVEGLREIQKKYGDVHTVWLGPLPTVNLCTIESARDLMVSQGPTQTGRHNAFFVRVGAYDENGNQRGIVSTEGEDWQQHRRFALQALRNFGMGSNLQERRINEEFEFQMSLVEKKFVNGKGSVFVKEFTDMTVASIINRFLYGYGFDEDTRKKFRAVKELVDHEADQASGFDFLVDDWWRNVPILKKRYYRFVDALKPLQDFAKENVERRKREIATGNHVPSDFGDDYIDAYLLEQKKRVKETGSEGYFDDAGLLADLVDLWFAGHETTSTTLQWAFHEVVTKPDVMKRCKQELERVTGGARLLSLNDRSSVPYFNAVCMEVQRFASILSVNLWRKTSAPCKAGGINIPVGTVTAAQIALIMSDKNVFNAPDQFNPDRYLGPDGKTFEQSTIPFGIGKRSCLGESLARAEIFLILGNALLRYNLSPDPKSLPKGEFSKTSFTRRTQPFRVFFEKVE